MPLSEGTAATPLAAILIKPWKPLSLYASYAEGFGFGPTAPIGSANYGAVFPPIVTKQLETGAKLDFGNFGATLTFFQITQPSTFTDPTTNIFSVSGEQQNKGIEFNVFGTLTESVRLLGGISLLDGVLTKTAGGIDNGKMAPGVPHVQLNLGAEYDLPFSAKGFTLTGRVIYTSAQFYDEGNTQSIPGWTRLDLGVRYRWIGEDGNPATVRFNVENVTGENYWASTGAGQLTLGMPRTYKLSLSKDF
jgi:iron complex outermembrane receptor protein